MMRRCSCAKLSGAIFRNRRELGGWSGFAPLPWASGSVSRDQGITKAGPPMLRAHMIQITWRWLFWQPDSDLSKWFQKRTDGAIKKTGGAEGQSGAAKASDGKMSQGMMGGEMEEPMHPPRSKRPPLTASRRAMTA
jgi:hypothetical protein